MRALLAVYVALLAVVATVGAASADPPPNVQAPACPGVLAGNRHGHDAVSELGDQLPNVAAWNRVDPGHLREWLDRDDTLWVDPCGRLFYSDYAAATGPAQASVATMAFAADQTFLLHSRPGASRVLYIDFNGELISGTAWNASYNGGQDMIAPGFDIDGIPTGFSADELAIIQQVWLSVAEDYAPFDVDVTTADPGLAAIDRSSSTDTVFGTRVLVTNDTLIYGACGCGGISYVGVFDSSISHQYYQPAWAFEYFAGASAKTIADVVAHEAGHNLGLSHDGTASSGYYTGAGSWAPIMGKPYVRPVSQWSKGEYRGANNTEDDIAVIASHGAALRSDDVPSTRSAALALQSGTQFHGFIGTAADTDWFSLSGSGQLSATANVAAVYPNLDLRVEVYDSAGTLLAAADPPVATDDASSTATGLSAALTVTLPVAGTYYIKLDGVGYGDPLGTGYSDYASVGEYTLTATIQNPTYPPQVTTDALPAATTFQGYSATVSASGGVAPYTWSLAAGSAALPSGLTLAPGTGVISGTPTALAGTYTVNLKVTDSVSNSGTRSLAITVTDAPLAISTATLAPGSLSQAYSQQLGATGGRGSYAWSKSSGTLPTGLSLSSAGVISGTPSVSGTYSFTVKVTSDTSSATKSFSMTVTAALKVTTTSLAVGDVGAAYSATLAASGGTGTYTWSLYSGTLPTGLSLGSGKVSGTPSVRGTWSFVVRVTDSAGRSALSGALSITIYQLAITTTVLPDAVKGKAYSFTLTADGGKPTYTWTKYSGSFPSGVSMSSSGVISGTPTTTGTFTFTLKVTDTRAKTATRTLTLKVT